MLGDARSFPALQQDEKWELEAQGAGIEFSWQSEEVCNASNWAGAGI